MNWLAPKLSLRVAQKQILTPGLVQMVSVLALNRLESVSYTHLDVYKRQLICRARIR